MSTYSPNPMPQQFNSPTSENDLIRELSLPIYQSKGWLKLIGILSIVGGVIQALSIVGIIVAWLPIWMGVILYQAATNIETANTTGYRPAMITSLNNIKTYFVINGVLVLIGLILTFLMLCIMFILPLLGISLIPFLDNLDYLYSY